MEENFDIQETTIDWKNLQDILGLDASDAIDLSSLAPDDKLKSLSSLAQKMLDMETSIDKIEALPKLHNSIGASTLLQKLAKVYNCIVL
jgi:hypothetical protein